MLSEPGYIPKGYLYRKNRMPAFYKKAMEYLEIKQSLELSSADTSINEDLDDHE